jgi:hypothetical protein
MTREEKDYLDKLSSLGCYCCKVDYKIETPANIHHIREGQGMGQRSEHIGETIPLCEGHHQGNFDTSKLAFHKNPKAWREKYGSEADIARGYHTLILKLNSENPGWDGQLKYI